MIKNYYGIRYNNLKRKGATANVIKTMDLPLAVVRHPPMEYTAHGNLSTKSCRKLCKTQSSPLQSNI